MELSTPPDIATATRVSEGALAKPKLFKEAGVTNLLDSRLSTLVFSAIIVRIMLLFRLFLILTALFSASGSFAQAEQRALPRSQAEIQLSFAPLVKKAAPAVVNIYSSRKVRVRDTFSPFFNDELFGQLFGDDFVFGRPRDKVVNSLGSGVIIDPRGFVITNNHVIEGSQDIKIVLSDRREFEADVVIRDDKSDLALLAIRNGKTQLPYLELEDADTLQVGDLVLAIGNPFGVGQTVTSGIVSATARTMVGISDYQFFIQTDAAINPGNSGGALINMAGKLVGVPTAIFSKTGGSLGISFAIPSTMVASLLNSHVSGGHIVRPWLGASGQDVTTDLASSLGLDRPVGVLVTEVAPGGAAESAGLQIGDVILKIGEFEVMDGQSLRFRIATSRLNETVPLHIMRKGRPYLLNATLTAPPETVPRQTTELEGNHPLSGTTVANLSPAVAEEIGASEYRGVVIMDVAPGSIAHRLTFQRGDIILAINKDKVDSVKRLRNMLDSNYSRWSIDVKRAGRMLTINISL